MSKKKVELTKFSGWHEQRSNRVEQHLNPDGTEETTRTYFGYWRRVEDGEVIVEADLKPTEPFGQAGAFRVEVVAFNSDDMITMKTVARDIDSAKSMAEHRAQKWIEQYSKFLLPTIN